MTRKYANAKNWSPDYPHWLKMNYFQDVPYPASAAAVTSLGSITAGTGFSSIGTIAIAPSGGTLTAGVSPADPAIVVPLSLKAITATVVAPGTGVAVSDTFSPVGGTIVPAGPYGTSTTTAGAASVFTATHVQVVSVVVLTGGSSGTPGAVTLTGVTGTGTKWAGTATVPAGGAYTVGQVVTITVPGDYTVQPTTAGDTATGTGMPTGCTFTLVTGAKTFTVSGGSYSTAPTLTACPLTGAGTGSGTGVTATLVYGLGAALVQHSGNYSGAPAFTVTDSASGTGASIATATLGGSGAAIPRLVAETVGLTNLPANSTTGLPSYGVFVNSNVTALASAVVTQKTLNGFTVAVAGATTLAAGTFDALVVA